MSDPSSPHLPVDGAAAPALLPVPGETDDERRRAMYEYLFEHNPNCVVFADSEGRVAINPAALALFRVNPT